MPDSLKKALELIDNPEENKEELIQFFESYYGGRYDADGNQISTYNPDSKWDWWVIGGRFDDYFSSGDNSVQLKDIKLFNVDGKTTEELEAMYKRDYREWKKLITKGGTFYKPEYYQEYYPTFESYLISTKNPISHSVVDENGEWHEIGQMGWFGVSDTENAREWPAKYVEMLEKLPDDYWLTIVDCHI